MAHLRTALAFAPILSPQAGSMKQSPAAIVATAPESLDLNMYSRIRDEGFRHSHVMEFASALTDNIGPRLTGSPAMAAANEWSRAQLAAMGCANGHFPLQHRHAGRNAASS